MAAFAALGLITAAVYSLILMQKAFYGKPNENLKVADFGSLEMTAMAVMIIGLIWLGLYPQPVLDMVQPVLNSLYIETNTVPLLENRDVGLIESVNLVGGSE
jgi:NADH-quinone oxidoreductase subunit M